MDFLRARESPILTALVRVGTFFGRETGQSLVFLTVDTKFQNQVEAVRRKSQVSENFHIPKDVLRVVDARDLSQLVQLVAGFNHAHCS